MCAQELVKRPPLPHCVIDLGCGTGFAVRSWLDVLLAEEQPPPLHLFLVDQARSMVEQAMAVVRQRHANVQGLILDIFDCQEIAGSVLLQAAQSPRLVISSYALQWCPAPVSVIDTVWVRLLRPGDWLAVALPDARSFGVLHAALIAADLPSYFLNLPEADDLIGKKARRILSSSFEWVASGSFANGVPVASALDYLRHFTHIGARPARSRYSRSELIRLCRCLDQQLSAGKAELDYHSTWIVLRRL